MSAAWYIAKRYLLSHRKIRFLSFITTFAILGVMLGTAALIITLSIVDGFERDAQGQRALGMAFQVPDQTREE